MVMDRRRLGEILLEAGLVKSAELQEALDMQRARGGGRIGSILVRLGSLSEDGLYSALAVQSGRPLASESDLDWARVNTAVEGSGKTAHWWRRLRSVPWSDDSGSLHVAAHDPLDLELQESLESLGQRPLVHYVPPALLERKLAAFEVDFSKAMPRTLDAKALRELAEDAPVIALVNNVLAQAVESRASDIHLEPGERTYAIRFRVDGVLQTRSNRTLDEFPAVASRIKLISALDIAERRLPQDGRLSTRVAGAEMEVRVSVIPAVHGESLVLRLLPKERPDLQLDRLGLSNDHLTLFRHWLGWANGLVLVTGPTGSGKSTTLYGALAEINDLTRKIVTVEDPVEYRLRDVVQVQTHQDIGYTFARALRSILRHDPDIIMIGEIRDRETAEIAIQAALTGHLVLATLHTNDALSAVTRLTDMGVEPYLVSASVRGLMAQRLVRRFCANCAVKAAPDTEAELQGQRLAAADAAKGVTRTRRWMQAVGCSACEGTGFRGRLGIYELVEVGVAMQSAISSERPLEELRALAGSEGYRTLLDDGLLKVFDGQTSYGEVLRAVGSVTEA
jgi:general secretion pathway protein E